MSISFNTFAFPHFLINTKTLLQHFNLHNNMELEIDTLDNFVPADANFRIIRGKQRSSKIYVKEPYTYIQDKSISAIDRMYLKCRISTCQARGAIENTKFLHLSPSRPHTCFDSEDMAMTIITSLELTSKMKMRAENEPSTFFVSTLFELPTVIHTLFPTLFAQIANISFFSFPNIYFQQHLTHFFRHY